MRNFALLPLLLLVSPAFAERALIDACRASHADDPAAHITCLETALSTRDCESHPVPKADNAPKATVAPRVESGPELGAEQVKRKTESRDPVTVRVVSATYNSQGLGQFRLEGGQLWRETMTSPAHLRLAPDTEYSARIERSRFGGYRMYVDGIRWMKRVERLE